jgi:hypothetical protein
VKQKFLLTGLAVTGRHAVIQQKKVNTLISNIARWVDDTTPVFDILTRIPSRIFRITVLRELKAVSLGQYDRTADAICWLANEHLKDPQFFESVTRDYLVGCPGIGWKTASFYEMYSKQKPWCAVLDVHILRWLRSLGVTVPHQTPQSYKKYREIEDRFLSEANAQGVTPETLAGFDFALWKQRAIKQ